MIRIALVGDSHLANWKRAWDSFGKACTDIDLVFFAAAGLRLQCCQPRGDRLVFEDEEVARWMEITSRGRRELVPADYDVVCVVGLRFGVRTVMDLYARWRADAHQGNEGKYQVVSDACFQQTVSDRLNASSAMILVRKLRQTTDKPIWLAVQPAPSEIVLTLEKFPKGLQWATAANDAPSLRATYQEVCRRLAEQDVIVLDQPAATLAAPLVSKDEYRRPSETGVDWTHLNDAYGEIALRELLSQFQPGLDGQAGEQDRVGNDEQPAEGSGDTSPWSVVKRVLRGRRSLFSSRTDPEAR